MENTFTAFEGQKIVAQGDLSEVVLKIKKRLGKSESHDVLIFSDETGKTMDFSFQGSEKDLLRRLEVYTQPAPSKDGGGPGRPKLGVISREVSLLPRHWEWLATQSGGASATLRLLVEQAKKKAGGALSVKAAQERTYKFMLTMAGDLKGYEEALRALYKRDKKGFAAQITDWPADIRTHAFTLAKVVFEGD